MKFGCIGEHLQHSFSREIHARLASNEYELCELTPTAVDGFMKQHDFVGINVTIPYKQTVIPYLDEIDPAAREIGAVNTIVNRNGKLCGYNTDLGGMRMMMQRAGIDPCGKKVLVLGTGGTSKTARAVAASMGARAVVVVSRTAKDGAIDYPTAYAEHTDAEIIINTTPCGMYPKAEGMPIDISDFRCLSGVVDAIYNPLRSNLVLSARERGISAVGGLYMLVAQAVLASSHFTGIDYDMQTVDRIYAEVMAQKQSIVLVGMPGSGKSTVGKLLADKTGKRLIDTDEVIERISGKTIPQIFAEVGEQGFRDIESEAIASVAVESGCIIATGGGAVLRSANVHMLRQNGRLFFLDRALGDLLPTEDRPLAQTADAIKQRYEERYDIYCECADEIIKIEGGPDWVVEEIKRRGTL